MRETSYGEAAVEVLDILNYMEREDVRKIPQSFINFLNEIADKNYRANFNHNTPISGLNLKKKTRELLGFIYITWWANVKEKNNYKNIIQSNNLNLEKVNNYDTDNIFKNKKQTNTVTESVAMNHTNTVTENVTKKETYMTQYKEESLFKKIVNKITNLFTNKKN